MPTTIFGVGVGLVILITIWIVAICIAIVSLRTRRNLGTIAIFVAFIITVILLLIPLESKIPTLVVRKIYDEVFIWRSSLLIVLAVSLVVGSISYFITHLMEPRFAQMIKDKRI